MKAATLLVLSLIVLMNSCATTSVPEVSSKSLVEDATTNADTSHIVPVPDTEKVVQGVIALTSKDFDISIRDGNIWLIEFYAPWCSHCVRFASTYDSLAMKLHGMHEMSERKVMVAKVDGSSDRMLASRFSVRGFPTFFLVDGWTVWEFEGNRSKENIIKFATDNDKEMEPIPFLNSPFGPMGQARSVLVHVGVKVLGTYDGMVDKGYAPAFAAIVIGSVGVIFSIIFILVVGFWTLPKIKDD